MTQQKRSFNRQRKDGFKLAVDRVGLFDVPQKSPPPIEKKFPEEKRFGDIRQKIVDLYHKNPLVVEDDRLLTFEVWKEEGLVEVLKQRSIERLMHWFLFEATDGETIRRSRRALTSDKHGPPVIEVSEETQKNRRKYSDAWRKHWTEGDKKEREENPLEFMQKYFAYLKSRAGIDAHGIPPFE